MQGELGDSTMALSKEWQALTPRSALSESSGAPLPAHCLDSLLDGIAELSTSAADGGSSSGGASSASVRGGCSYTGGRRTSGDSPSSLSGQHVGELQVLVHRDLVVVNEPCMHLCICGSCSPNQHVLPGVPDDEKGNVSNELALTSTHDQH